MVAPILYQQMAIYPMPSRVFIPDPQSRPGVHNPRHRFLSVCRLLQPWFNHVTAKEEMRDESLLLGGGIDKPRKLLPLTLSSYVSIPSTSTLQPLTLFILPNKTFFTYTVTKISTDFHPQFAASV